MSAFGCWAAIPFTPPEYLPLIGPLKLSAHGAAFLVAALVSLYLTKRRTPPQYHRALEDAIPFMIVGAVLGARGLYVIQKPAMWVKPWTVFAFWEGGLVSYGGMVGAVLAFYLYLRYRKLPAARICDALAPTALVGWGIGRIGCFLSWYDEFGTLTDVPWAFEVAGEVRHPVMLYLTICLVTAGCLLMRLPTDKPFRVTGMALLAEGIIRGTLDEWRDYDPDWLVWTSRAACLAIALWGIWLIRRSEKIPPEKSEVESSGEDSLG